MEKLYKVDGKKEIFLGEIEVIQPRFLFKWQDQAYHKAWVQGEGINKADINLILQSPPQFYGREFYVSLYPLDSSHFGSHLTIFEVGQPLVLLQNINLNYIAGNDTIADQLRQSGFAGVRGRETLLAGSCYNNQV